MIRCRYQSALWRTLKACRTTFVETAVYIYRLTHSANELSGFTCTSSLTMNEKIQYRTRPPSAVLKISSSLLVNSCR